MTTDVQERLALPPVAPRRVRGLRAWIVFFVAVVLAALAIGVIAAAFGNAIKALDGANAAESAAQSALVTADAGLASAQDALAAAEAAVETRRDAIIEELRTQPQTTTFSMSASSPAFDEVRGMERSIEQNERAALDAATSARAAAAAEVAASSGETVQAQRAVDAAAQPLWIASIASGVALLALLVVAIVMSLRPRRG